MAIIAGSLTCRKWMYQSLKDFVHLQNRLQWRINWLFGIILRINSDI